jgi:hypothetical protein
MTPLDSHFEPTSAGARAFLGKPAKQHLIGGAWMPASSGKRPSLRHGSLSPTIALFGELFADNIQERGY